MIKYQLKCAQLHEFQGWFRNSADFDEQSDNGYLSCPVCGSEDVTKAIMAPAIPKKANARAGSAQAEAEPKGLPVPASSNPVVTRDHAKLEKIRADIVAAAERAREYVEKNFDYVGDEFPEQARQMHYGEADERAIYGEATREEVEDLIDEGVNVAPVPSKKVAKVIKKTEKKKLN